MDCRTASLLIEAYHDDELELVDAAHLIAHLEECPPCRQRSDEAARLGEAVRSGRPRDRCPEELARRLALCVEPPGPPRRRSRGPIVVVLAGGCCLLAGWAAGRLVPAPARGPLALTASRRTFDADVFCLRCALRALFPASAAETGAHRPLLRTADGKLWVVKPDSPARARFTESGPRPRHVVVTAELDESSGLADVSDVSDVSEAAGAPPAAR